MKKNRLLFLLLSLFMVCIGARADEVLIGDESSTVGNNYLPGYNFYNYSLTQQIYTAAEIGTLGTINSIAFKNIGAEKTRTYAIYMSQTDKDGFANGNDWVAVSDADLVFTGELTFTVGEWTVIQLDTPFEYDDGSNLLVTVADNSGNYSGSPYMSCLVFDASKQAIRAYRDGGAYDVSSPGAEGAVLNVKNQIILDIEPPVGDCARPSTLTASDVTTHEATLTWEDGSGTYNVEYKTNAEEEWSPAASSIDAYTLTLEGLEQNTEYQARVQSVCDVNEVSAWKSISFTTAIACPAPTGLTAETIPGDGTSAILSWTENGQATEWQICLNNDEENLVNANSNPFTVTGLTPEAIYSAKVRAIDGDEHSSWSEPVTFNPTEKVIIGSGTGTSGNLPTNCYYRYTLSEQIYTASEIGDEPGAILSVDFFNNATSERVRTLNVYLVSTEKNSFSSTSDWIPVTASDLVFSGSVTFAPQTWTTIEFESPFVYDGSSNVAIIVDDNTGSYASITPFLAYEATGQAIRTMSDSTNPDPENPSGGQVENMKNQIRLLIGDVPSCIKPSGLTVDYTGGTTAVVTWEGDADSYDIEVNGQKTEGVTSPYTLENLEMATPYAVKVRTNCGGGDVSDWTKEVSFITDICMPEDQCVLTFLVADQYGDGWNGASIQVVDAATETVLATITNAGDNQIEQYVINVCKDRELDFVWVSGSYDSECYFAIFDVNEEELFYGEDVTGTFFTYTPDCIETSCRMVTDLAVSEIGGKSVKLSWTENGEADAWIVAYKQAEAEEFTEVRAEENPFKLEGLSPETDYIVKVTSDCDVQKWSEEVAFTTSDLSPINIIASHVGPNSANIGWEGYTCGYDVRYGTQDPDAPMVQSWLKYDNDDLYSPIGLQTGAGFSWAVMFPAGTRTESISKISLYDCATMTGTAAIYNGGTTAPEGDALGTVEISTTKAEEFVEFEFNRPIEINPAENLWVVVTASSYTEYPAAASTENSDANGRWVELNGNWYDLHDVGVADGGSWMLRAYGEMPDPESIAWSEPVSTSDTSYQLEDLDPETVYVVEVRGNCPDEDIVTDWVSTSFTTTKNNPIPNIVEVDPKASTADITWEGFSDSYTVNYRTAVIENPISIEDFENGLEGWTVITNGQAPQADGWYAYDPTQGLSFEAHSGSYVASAWSWTGGTAFSADNWLISPELDLGSVLKFWERTNDQGYPDSYEVLLSIDGSDTSDFRITLREMAPSEGEGFWNRVSIDLSEYAGQKGYIAFHHVSTDMNYLLIDDFGLYEEDTPAGEWMTVETAEQSVELTDLTPDTDYEFYIIGTKDGEEPVNTEIYPFTTSPAVIVTIKEGFAGTTVASPYALDFTGSGLTVYKATGTIGTNIVYIDTEAMNEGIVPAEEGILVKGEPGTYLIPVVEDAENAFFSDNLLVAAIDGYIVSSDDVAEKTVYRYGKAGGKCGFQLVTKLGQDVGAGKAYLRLTEALAEAAAALGIAFIGDGTTGIDAVSTDMLDENAPMFNTAGQRVQKSFKGVVIQNGKKFIKK